MQDRVRNTGIDLIGNAPWGTHFCQFYQTPEDLLDILVPYFTAGLRGKEFCMWVTSEPLGPEAAEKALRQAVPDLDRYLESAQLEILPYSDWYVKDGKFESERVLQGWLNKLEGALAKGYEGLRLTGNTFWLEKSTWKDFADYEEAVDGVIGQYRMLAICTYSLDRCSAAEVIDVIRNHAFALIKRDGQWEIIESAERRRLGEALIASEERYRLLNEHLLRRTAELDAANRELEAFSYSVSHDLRAPLRSINGISGMLQEDFGDKLGELGVSHLQRIRAESRRMAELIDDLLNLARIGRSEMRLEAVDLSELVNSVANRLRENEPAREVEFAIEHGLMAESDPRLMQVALQNLLDNAWKFTARQPRARIEFGATTQDGRTSFFVRDNGCGFDMAHAANLFAPFQRLHRSEEFPGSGVGLATVRTIVRRHGGEIWANAAHGSGATFYFTL